MSTLTYIIIFSIGGGLLSLAGGVLLLSKKTFADKFAFFATPFAAGALLAAVFFDLLPEGVVLAEPQTVFASAAAGVVIFFLLERWLHYFHHHRHGRHNDKDPNRFLVIAGDTLHNGIDGMVIAVSFLVSAPTGIATTLAVIAHEIPQEIGDFGLLLSKGMSRFRVLIVNIISSLTLTLTAVITYFIGSADKLPIGAALGLGAGFLLYIAMSDIIPSLHRTNDRRRVIDWRVISLAIGLVLVAGLIVLAHRYVDEGHGHGENHSTQHQQNHHNDHHDAHDH